MQYNILWSGVEYYSLENCRLINSGRGVDINSVIVGSYEGQIYRVKYRIETSPDWETNFAEVRCHITSSEREIENQIILSSDMQGNWQLNQQPAPELSGCTEIDISLTPFTNTLPINRLRLQPDEHQIIQIVYIDLLGNQISTRQQKYTRLSESTYRYENIPNDFEAVIEVDENGLVTDYPELFERKAIITSRSPSAT